MALRPAVVFALALTAAALHGAAHAAARPVVVASKIDTEGALLGNMIAEVAGGARHCRSSASIQLGPTNIVRAAILAGQIDLYPEYTGNGAFFFHRESDPAWKDAAAGYDAVKKLDRDANHLVWLNPAPANNTWVIAIRGDLPGFPARQMPRRSGGYARRGRAAQARRLGRVRREPGGAAGVRDRPTGFTCARTSC